MKIPCVLAQMFIVTRPIFTWAKHVSNKDQAIIRLSSQMFIYLKTTVL